VEFDFETTNISNIDHRHFILTSYILKPIL